MDTPATAAAHAHGAAGQFRLVPSQNGRLAAQGPLTFATARRAREQGLEAVAAATGTLEIDCSAVTAGDSAGLAVLLDWLGAARQSGRKLRYTHLPQGLTALARISEAEELLARGV